MQKKRLGTAVSCRATRNNNSEMFRKMGANAGYDAIGEPYYAQRLSVLLDALNSEENWPKPLYTI